MKKPTQKDKVLTWLRTKGELTTRQAVIELDIMALPKRIMELREDGYDIELNYKKSRNGSKYGVYTLVKD